MVAGYLLAEMIHERCGGNRAKPGDGAQRDEKEWRDPRRLASRQRDQLGANETALIRTEPDASLLRHPSLAQPDNVSRLEKLADHRHHRPKTQARNARIPTVAVQPP